MRNLTLLFAFIFIGWSVSASVNSNPTNNYYNDSFIFIEGGVEFAVYPNGEFDFYFNPEFRRGNSVHISTPHTNISYNSGYNYDPYVQYDDYGAVIQIETVPVYYDYYGRIIQAGSVFIRYNNFGRISRIGNLHLHYDHHHHFSHYSGFINHYNRHYVHKPWHRYYTRPHVNVSIVFNRPYRAYYQPHRISYNKYVSVYNNYYVKNNGRRNFYRPSDRIRSYNYGSKTASKRDLSQVRTRSNDNIARSRQNVARSKSYTNRNESVRSSNSTDRTRAYSERNTVGQNDNPRAKVYSDRSERRTLSRNDESRSKLYSSRTERSTNSRGRSSNTGNIEKKERSYEHRSVKTPVQNTRKSSPQVESPSRITRSRSFERSGRSSERNPSMQRQNTHRNSSVRSRSSSGTSRSGAVRSKNSSRSRSSARNME